MAALKDAGCTFSEIEMTFQVKLKVFGLLSILIASIGSATAQTVPTFVHKAGANSYTLVGGDPAKGGTTTIPAVIAPVALTFESKKIAGKAFVLDAAGDVPALKRSPVFAKFN